MRRTVIGFSGNFIRPSKTRGFVQLATTAVAERYGLVGEAFDIVDLGPSFGLARTAQELDAHAAAILDKVTRADVLVVGSPTYKGSYTGLFKHFFDLIDPTALRGKPVLLTATGGGERHSLIVEHQLRPLFAFFEAFALPTAIYATEKDFVEGALVSGAIRRRLIQAVDEVVPFLDRQDHRSIAAE